MACAKDADNMELSLRLLQCITSFQCLRTEIVTTCVSDVSAMKI